MDSNSVTITANNDSLQFTKLLKQAKCFPQQHILKLRLQSTFSGFQNFWKTYFFAEFFLFTP